MGALVVGGALLEVLVLNLDRDEELDAAVVLLLVAGHEGRLLTRRVVLLALIRRFL